MTAEPKMFYEVESLDWNVRGMFVVGVRFLPSPFTSIFDIIRNKLNFYLCWYISIFSCINILYKNYLDLTILSVKLILNAPVCPILNVNTVGLPTPLNSTFLHKDPLFWLSYSNFPVALLGPIVFCFITILNC